MLTEKLSGVITEAMHEFAAEIVVAELQDYYNILVSFYVYPDDVTVLRAIETVLGDYMEAEEHAAWLRDNRYGGFLSDDTHTD
jgi:hypothetical protein